jgi:polysaccharide deacetylase family protein (PEP-CTERM system associated)
MHALSVDVEEYFHVTRFADVIAPQEWERLPSRVEPSTRRLLDVFDATGARATFFTLGWVAERHPALLREIAERGHEVACHGHAHRTLGGMEPGEFRTDVRRARAAIEDAIGRRPVGFRAPSFSVTRRTTWALRVLAEEGFEYDSSIFPVHHPRYGIPRFDRGIVRLELGDGASLLEFPPTTLSLGAWNLPIAGGAYLRLLPAAPFRKGFRRATRERPGLLYVHPWEIDPDQPRVRARWPGRAIHYWNLHRTEGRLLALLRAAQFASLAEILSRAVDTGRVPSRWIDCARPAQIAAPDAPALAEAQESS